MNYVSGEELKRVTADYYRNPTQATGREYDRTHEAVKKEVEDSKKRFTVIQYLWKDKYVNWAVMCLSGVTSDPGARSCICWCFNEKEAQQIADYLNNDKNNPL